MRNRPGGNRLIAKPLVAARAQIIGEEFRRHKGRLFVLGALRD
jgi:hypothetical protein